MNTKKTYKKVERIRHVDSIENFNKILAIADKLTNIVKPDEKRKPLRFFSLLVDAQRYIKLTTQYVSEDFKETTKYPCTWVFDKTGKNDQAVSMISIAKAYNNVYKPNEIGDVCKKSAKPVLGFNPKFDKTEHNVVIYDLNSAYATVLKNKIIDTYKPRFFGVVGPNEIGFIDDLNLELQHEGQPADIIFPLIESPYKDFIKKWYNIKKKAPKESREKKEAKNYLNNGVGNWQNHNPYLRAYVVNSCNEFIEKLVNKYKDKVCLWNTDAIYATEHIKELDDMLGDDIGQFKIEYEGLFRQKGLNYQKGEEVSYRGVCKCCFPKNYNLLTDKLPAKNLPYKLDGFKVIADEEYNKIIGVLENGENI